MYVCDRKGADFWCGGSPRRGQYKDVKMVDVENEVKVLGLQCFNWPYLRKFSRHNIKFFWCSEILGGEIGFDVLTVKFGKMSKIQTLPHLGQFVRY